MLTKSSNYLQVYMLYAKGKAVYFQINFLTNALRIEVKEIKVQ